MFTKTLCTHAYVSELWAPSLHLSKSSSSRILGLTTAQLYSLECKIVWPWQRHWKYMWRQQLLPKTIQLCLSPDSTIKQTDTQETTSGSGVVRAAHLRLSFTLLPFLAPRLPFVWPLTMDMWTQASHTSRHNGHSGKFRTMLNISKHSLAALVILLESFSLSCSCPKVCSMFNPSHQTNKPTNFLQNDLSLTSLPRLFVATQPPCRPLARHEFLGESRRQGLFLCRCCRVQKFTTLLTIYIFQGFSLTGRKACVCANLHTLHVFWGIFPQEGLCVCNGSYNGPYQ